MDCSKCSAPAVTFVRTSGRHLCSDHLVRSVEKRAKHAIREQGGLPKGLIAVALSGGKDSLATLHILHNVLQGNPNTSLAAICVDEGIDGYRESALEIARQTCAELGIPMHVLATKDMAGYDMDEYASGQGKDPTGKDRPACGPCGVWRRFGMNKLARELGAAAIATGHNLDDQAQTILMNVLNGDSERLGRLAPHTAAGEGLVPRLLPLRFVPEKEVLLYALAKGLPLHEQECPYAERANRFRIRDLLWQLEEEQPGTRHRLLSFHDQVKPLLLAAQERPVLSACQECGEPTSGSTCKGCQWKA